MPTTQSPRQVGQTVASALASVRGPLVLAVSGGVDSMVLLHAVASHRALKRRCTVATFDHGTGPHATRAVRLVRSTARELGLSVVSGRAHSSASNEAAWRDMRWHFLRSVAEKRDATVVTAHTLDDQIETVVMRVMRGASARGLASLFAESPIVRPLLAVPRAAVQKYARANAIEIADDPTNASPSFLRNRVRRDLLPAIRKVRPTFEREMLALSKKAAEIRRETERLARQFVVSCEPNRVHLSVAALQDLTLDSVALLWPAFVARLGVPLDRRGVARATTFSLTSRAGQQAHCGGGVLLERTAEKIVVSVRRVVPATVELGSAVEFGVWSLRRVSRTAFESYVAQSGSVWAAAVAPERLYVRPWQPGDRVLPAGRPGSRRVKRYFNELAIPVSERLSWPVVIGAGGVLWVPGICHADATLKLPGHPLIYVICERRTG